MFPRIFLITFLTKLLWNFIQNLTFFYFSFQGYNEQERKNSQKSIENLLFYSLNDFKFITIHLSSNNQNNHTSFIHNKEELNSKFEDKTNLINVNAFFCVESKCLIIEQINILINAL